jgi:hypothetical protein
MASGFIILKNSACLATRWTGYDMLIRITCKELYKMEEGTPLADWLSTIIPKEYIQDDPLEMGWGFICPNRNTSISRELDLRSLTDRNQQLFWKALQVACRNLCILGSDYSALNPDRPKQLLKMYKHQNKGCDPLILSSWYKLAEACTEKNGPGW